jgi:hypothetical protein
MKDILVLRQALATRSFLHNRSSVCRRVERKSARSGSLYPLPGLRRVLRGAVGFVIWTTPQSRNEALSTVESLLCVRGSPERAVRLR